MAEVWQEKETEILQMYVDDIKKLEPEKEGEKTALFEKCINGDSYAVKRLVELYLMHVLQIASKYTGQGLGLADLLQEANVALMLGLTELNTAEKANDEYITSYVEQHIKRAIAVERNEKSSEEELAERVNFLSDVTRELAERFGREATLEEICEYTRYTEDEIRTLMKISIDAL